MKINSQCELIKEELSSRFCIESDSQAMNYTLIRLCKVQSKLDVSIMPLASYHGNLHAILERVIYLIFIRYVKCMKEKQEQKTGYMLEDGFITITGASHIPADLCNCKRTENT